MTEVVPELSQADARQLTDKIRDQAAGALALIAAAFHGRADVALGYESWDRYCHAELPALGWRTVGDRARAVAELHDEGMSNRAISHAVGIDEKTVRRDLDLAAANAAPENAAPGDACDPDLTVILHISPAHYARQAAALLADMDRQPIPVGLTPEQVRVTALLRAALAEFASVMDTEGIEDQ